MKRVYEQVGMCLAHAIRGKTCPSIPDLELALVMEEAKAHDVEGLLYKALKSQVDVDAYKQAVILKSLTQATYFQQALETLNVLQQNGMTVVLLKGSILKTCYPQADLRMMGDADILVPEEQLTQVHDLLTQLGYRRRSGHNEKHHVYDGTGFSLEVHWSLINASRQSGATLFEQKLWSQLEVVEIQGMCFKRLSNEDFLVHLLVHMAGHLKSGGFGIRQLCDAVLWMEQQALDFEKVVQTLQEMKLMTFTSYLMAACETLLQFNAPDELKRTKINQVDLEAFIETLFTGGVHGHREQGTQFGHYFAYGEHKTKSWIIFLQSVFPSIRDLPGRYTYAHKYPFLLPFAWIDRIFRVIFHQSFSWSEKLYILVKTPSIAKKKAKLLQCLELVE